METRRSKTLIKNDQTFLRLLTTRNDNFFDPLVSLRRNILGLPKWKKIYYWHNAFEDCSTAEGWNKISQWIQDSPKLIKETLESLPKEKRSQLLSGVEAICIKNGLSIEWRTCLLNLVISGFVMPPMFNLSLIADPDKKELQITLNPDTSLAETREAWWYVKSEQERIFGKARKRNITKKFPEILEIFAKQKIIKDLDDTLTDSDLAGRIFKNDPDISKIADKKRANRIKKIRSRMK